MKSANSLTLKKINRVEGQVILPGSKSLSNRALLISALASGRTRLLNVLKSDDTARMIEALQKLNVHLSVNTSSVDVEGLGGCFDEGLNQVELDLGNAGTAMRPLAATLAVSRGQFKLTGEARMMERPIGPLTEALKVLGLRIEYLNNDGYPPLLIRGTKPIKHETSIDGSLSSQFISALLMTAPVCGGLKIKVEGDLISKPYVDLTVALIEKFGAKVKRRGYNEFEVEGTGYTSPGTYLIEGDAQFFDVLAQMGAKVKRLENSVIVEKGELNGIEIDLNNMPDAAMTLVPLSLYTKGPVTITNIGSWRIKETDRIDAMANEMRKLGVKVESGRDFISIDASVRNQETPVFDTYNDHRMAMCMSLIALDRDIIINNPECTSKTFPGYFKVLSSITH